MSAVEWLMSAHVTAKLAEFRREDEALSELHSAHVEAWLAADPCAECGNLRPLVPYRYPLCAECCGDREAVAREECRREERGYAAMVRRMG